MFNDDDFDFDFGLTYSEYKDCSDEAKQEYYNYLYMLINNISIDYGMPMLSLMDWLRAKCHEHEAYEYLQIIKDFELYHRHNLDKYGTTY
jgi:hypothetical protein